MQNHTPSCLHFERCGGCSLQHLPEVEYYQFKIDILRKIIQRLQCAPEVLQEMVKIGAGERRRVEFKIALNKGKISLGFCEAKSNIVVDISMCPVIAPEIFALSEKLRELLESLKKAGNVDGINITKLDNGFDVYFAVKNSIIAGDREKIIEFAKQNNVLRMAEKIGKDELKIIQNFAPAITHFGTAKIELPAGAFLQATQVGQAAITDFILQNLRGKNVADLYSGCGTYSFPIAQLGAQTGANVQAYEGSYEMVLAFNNAIRQNGLDDKMSAQARDLYKNPVRADELKNFDAIIINPPRNGALPQTQQIAKSGVGNVIMVSCNPATFERDAKCLLQAGYIIDKIVPIDQFLWSNHLELVASFKK